MRVGDHVTIVSGRYIGYEGAVIGGDREKGYVTVNVWGTHSLRFAPEQLARIVRRDWIK